MEQIINNPPLSPNNPLAWKDSDPLTEEIITKLVSSNTGSASEQSKQRIPGLDLEISSDGCDTSKPKGPRPSACALASGLNFRPDFIGYYRHYHFNLPAGFGVLPRSPICYDDPATPIGSIWGVTPSSDEPTTKRASWGKYLRLRRQDETQKHDERDYLIKEEILRKRDQEDEYRMKLEDDENEDDENEGDESEDDENREDVENVQEDEDDYA